jgi:DNA gyrase subunit A
VFARFADEDRIIALAKNTERNLDADAVSDSVPESAAAVADTDSVTTESRAADQGESEPDGKEESTNE